MMVGFYENREDKIGKHVPMDKMLDAIKNEVWGKQAREVKVAKDPKIADAKKSMMPCFIPAGVCDNRGKGAQNFKKHSGFCCLDIDEGIAKISATKYALSKDPYCYAIFYSVSGNGLAMIVRIPPKKETHEFHYKWLCKYIKDKYGCYGSDSQRNVNRLRYVSSDEGLVRNRNAKVCSETIVSEKPGMSWANLPSLGPDYDKFDLEIEGDRYKYGCAVKGEWDTFAEGNRNDFVTRLCFYLNELAVTQDYAAFHLNEDYAEDDFGEDEIRATAKSTYGSRVKDFGKLLAELGVKGVNKDAKSQKSNRGKKTSRITQFINSTGVSHNEFTQDFDLKGEPIGQLEYNTIYLDVMAQISVSIGLFGTIFHSTKPNRHNPIKNFVEKYRDRKSDGEGAIAHWAGCIKSESGYMNDQFDPDFQLTYMRKWYVAMIAQALGDTEKDRNEWFLALLGHKHGTGKTRFLTEFTLPDELSRYSTSKPIGDTKDDDYSLLLCQMLLLVDDELDGKGWQDMKNFKSIMSRKSIPIRRKYDRKHTHMLRRATLCGTGNEYEVLTEYANRRIIPIQVIDVNLDELEQVDRTAVFIEAYQLYASGFEWWFTEDDRDRMMVVSEDFRSPTLVGEYLRYWCEPPENENDRADVVLATELVTFLRDRYPGGRFTPKALGKIMTDRGFDKIRVMPSKLTGYIMSKKSRYFEGYVPVINMGYKKESNDGSRQTQLPLNP